MKVLSLGDIHGRDVWKTILFGSNVAYDHWKIAVFEGAPFDYDESLPFMEYDQIIFVGDYVDSFDIYSALIIHNLKEIIEFKKAVGDKVILLIGNHDISYFVDGHRCSGHRPESQIDIDLIFKGNLDLFKFAHQLEITGKTYLWTHAGVTNNWLKEMRSELYSGTMRFADIVKESPTDTYEDELNLAWQFKLPSIFNCDADSGGYSSYAGPVWVRPRRLNHDAVRGINQIVGHTTRDRVIETKVNDDTTLWYIDCLEFGDEKVFKLIIDT